MAAIISNTASGGCITASSTIKKVIPSGTIINNTTNYNHNNTNNFISGVVKLQQSLVRKSRTVSVLNWSEVEHTLDLYAHQQLHSHPPLPLASLHVQPNRQHQLQLQRDTIAATFFTRTPLRPLVAAVVPYTSMSTQSSSYSSSSSFRVLSDTVDKRREHN